jgi:hypothetical protein
MVGLPPVLAMPLVLAIPLGQEAVGERLRRQ